MSALFKSLSELLEKIEATTKRLEIVDLTANYLKTLASDEIETAANMMIGRAFPKHSQKTLDVSWSTLTRVLDRVSQFEWDNFREAMAYTGDIGSATKAVLEQSKAKRQTQLTQKPLTITEVRRALEAIAQASGVGSRTKKERLITQPLQPSHPS